jgi:hypothetical protein
MKLRITKGRIACAVVLLPVLFVLNLGPLSYCRVRFGFPSARLVSAIYGPFFVATEGSEVSEAVYVYVMWWMHLGTPTDTGPLIHISELPQSTETDTAL